MSSLQQLIHQCQQERTRFRNQGDTVSPACVEIFRRAFGGDQSAWSALWETFQPLTRAWLNAALNVEGVDEQFIRFVRSNDEFDSILNTAWANFSRSAPKSTTLLQTDQLGPVLKYLRNCVKTALFDAIDDFLSKQERDDSIDDLPESVMQASQPRADSVLEEVLARIDSLLQDDKERLIFQLRFLEEMKPAEVLTLHGDLFVNIEQVFQAIKRIALRFRKDPALQRLSGRIESARRKAGSDPSLKMMLIDESEQFGQKEDGNVMPCHVNEAILLDYITGLASVEVSAEIERSPACLHAAKEMAAGIGPLMSILRRARCPDSATLIDYQEQQLTGTNFLVIDKHVKSCSRCQKDLRMMGAMDEVPLFAPTSIIRRFVEAVLRPATALPEPVRGPSIYATPQLFINLNLRTPMGRQRTWRLSGQLRTLDGQLFTAVEGVLLRDLAGPDLIVQETGLNATGTFVFEGLDAGKYSLSVLTVDQEIVIRELAVGDEL